MSFTSLGEIKPESNIVYDSRFCLVCHQTKNEQKLVATPTIATLADILGYHGTNQREGNLSNETSEPLLQKGYSYQSESAKRMKKYMHRRRSEENMLTITSSRRLTHSMLPTYDVNMCIVCQEKTEERRRQIMSDARDNQLIDAIHLNNLKVRFDHAVDASAGEIK